MAVLCKSRRAAWAPPPKPTVTESQPRPWNITVAILCHNYACYLRDCINSLAAQQGVILHQVFVIDDSSTDDTATVCAEMGMQYVRVEYRDVHKVRQHAYEISTGEIICFLDADDCLAPTYFAEGVKHFADFNVGIVYSDVEYFGNHGGRSNYPAAQVERNALRRLWHENFIHAGSLVRKQAIRQADAFNPVERVCSSHADWTLWKRIVRHGWTAVKQDGIYRYRKHGQSMLQSVQVRPYYERANLEREPVTLFTALSGRAELWDRFAQQLEDLDWPLEQLQLVLFDTSQDPAFSQKVRDWICKTKWRDVRHIQQAVAPPRVADIDRRFHKEVLSPVRTAMGRIYNWLRTHTNTHYQFVVEDDVFWPTPDILRRLMKSVTHDTYSVSAPYVSAYGPAYVCWELGCKAQKRFVQSAKEGVQQIGGNGFGCVVIRSTMLEEPLADQEQPQSGVLHSDYDVQLYTAMERQGKKCLIDWSLECEHISRVKAKST